MNLADLNKGDDVVHVTDAVNCGFMEGKTTIFVGQLITIVENCLAKGNIRALREDVALGCRILQSGKGDWQKGKLVLRLEFIPDEPTVSTSELDVLR